jgi:hypothetical protein
MTVRAERNPALGLKIPSSIRRQSHQQGCPESGLQLRVLRCGRGTADQRELPQPLPCLLVVKAPRRQAGRPVVGLRWLDAARAAGGPAWQGPGDRASLCLVRQRARQPRCIRHDAGRRHRRTHRANAAAALGPIACALPAGNSSRSPREHSAIRGDLGSAHAGAMGLVASQRDCGDCPGGAAL